MNNIKLLDKIDDVLVYDSGTVICDNICDIVFSDVRVARNYAFKNKISDGTLFEIAPFNYRIQDIPDDLLSGDRILVKLFDKIFLINNTENCSANIHIESELNSNHTYKQFFIYLNQELYYAFIYDRTDNEIIHHATNDTFIIFLK